MATFKSWKHTSTLLALTWIMVALLVPHATRAAGGPRKLIDPHVEDMSITSDSQWVVYYADNTLYSVPVTGGHPIQLNGPLADNSFITMPRFLMSPDGKWVLYGAKQVGDVGVHLYSVPVSGGTPVKLKPTSVFTEHIGEVEISPNSAHVVFRTYHHGYPPTPGELFSAPIDGRSPAIKLNAPLTNAQTVQDFQLSPDGSRVVYRVEERSGDASSSLYSVPTSGGASATLAGPYNTEDYPMIMSITPDSNRVIYNAQQPVGSQKLLSVPIAGGAITTLQTPPGVEINPFVHLTPDSSRVIFQTEVADQYLYELYSTPLSGAEAAVKLNESSIVAYLSFRVSPDGKYVVYPEYQGGDLMIYSIPVTGGSRNRISGMADTNGAATGERIFISPDSSRVVYLGLHAGTNPQVYSAPITGNAEPIKISDDVLPDGAISEREIVFTPDGKYVLYRAEGTTRTFYDLYRARMDGSSVKKLNQGVPVTAGEPYIVDYAPCCVISPDSRFVLFRGATNIGEPRALYIADLVEYTFGVYLPRLTR
jgi:Tol biopolymer transport system component